MFIIFIMILLLVLMLPLWLFPKPDNKLHEPFDYLLVLGNPCADDGTLSPTQQERIHTCIRYLQATSCRNVVISGGAVQNEFVEAEAMAQALHNEYHGCKIALECQAKNTFQNFQYTKKRYGKERILVITSDAHTRRAYFFAKKFYTHVSIAPSLQQASHKEKIIEYFRLWNVLYWEIRLTLFSHNS